MEDLEKENKLEEAATTALSGHTPILRRVPSLIFRAPKVKRPTLRTYVNEEVIVYNTNLEDRFYLCEIKRTKDWITCERPRSLLIEEESFQRHIKLVILTYLASDLVAWLMSNLSCDESEALSTGKTMYELKYIHRVKEKDKDEVVFQNSSDLFQFQVKVNLFTHFILGG